MSGALIGGVIGGIIGGAVAGGYAGKGVGELIDPTTEDDRIREYLLTQPGQKEVPGSNQTFHAHQSQLTQVWKDIHEGHEQLVELEASTIVKVEAQLTEVQLKKLDTTQSQASNTPKSQNDDSRR